MTSPELLALLAFFRGQREQPPQAFTHQASVMPAPVGFFSVARLQRLVNNPLLSHEWLTLYKRGERIPLESLMLWKVVMGKRLMFMDKTMLDAELAAGAALLLEGVDILDTDLNSFLAQADSLMPCALSNAVAFFSQKGHEAYKGHRDTDDVLVVQISGEKQWEIYAPQQRRYKESNALSQAEMEPLLTKLVMKPGDALFVRAGVPHRCQTVASHSLHLSFDLIDRTPNIEQITAEANNRYNAAASPPHVNAAAVTTRYIEMLQSPIFQNALSAETHNVRNTARAFRERIGKSQCIRALDKFILKT